MALPKGDLAENVIASLRAQASALPALREAIIAWPPYCVVADEMGTHEIVVTILHHHAPGAAQGIYLGCISGPAQRQVLFRDPRTRHVVVYADEYSPAVMRSVIATDDDADVIRA